MDTNFKIALSIVLAAVLTLAIAGAYQYPKPTMLAGATPQGSTGQTARQYNVYGVNLAAPGTNATSSSIYNGSGNDLYITGLKIGCESVGTSQTAYTGAGLAALTVSVATSSTANPTANANTNLVTGSAVTIATSTAQFVDAASSASASGSVSNIWKAGSYLTFTTNATNTAICTFGADVTSS